MSRLMKKSRRYTFALIIALGLTAIPVVVPVVVGETVASVMPGATEALADNPRGGG